MILVDYSQAMISAVMAYVDSNPQTKITEAEIRHVILDTLRKYSAQFKHKYGKLIICTDSKEYWRKEYFPYYKARRKEDRAKSGFDWLLIFNSLNKVKEELAGIVPYRIIEVEGAEADDVIAVLAKKFQATEEVLILSTDKDFLQLQKYPNIAQYSPRHKRFLQCDDPKAFLKEHIIKGDFDDGVPNFLSSDSCIVNKERQKSINTKKLLVWVTQEPDEICINETQLRNYKRNQTLVDLDYIPARIVNGIHDAFENTKPGSRNALMMYMGRHDMPLLIAALDQF